MGHRAVASAPAAIAGIDIQVSASKLEGHFKNAGYVNVRGFELHIGPWTKDPKLSEAAFDVGWIAGRG
jgi:hypothetical protein